MARATTVTKLPLERWATIAGVNPLHFNGMDSAIFPSSMSCAEVWAQFAYQNADAIGREELAQAIQEAERIIEDYINYHVLPDWQSSEYQPTTLPMSPEIVGTRPVTPLGKRKTVTTDFGHFISGGQRAQTLIEAGVAVVRTDTTGDTYFDTMTATVATTLTEACEIRAYYPGESGSEEWEIKPVTVTISGGVATIVFNSWQLVDPDLQLSLAFSNAIDADAAASYLTTIDVYRVFNDPQSQINLLWEGLPTTCNCGNSTCALCAWATQAGCMQGRKRRLGEVTYWPATWDADTESFTEANFVVCREPDKTQLYYYSGWRNMRLPCPDIVMDDYWARAVAYYAAALLDRPVCACNNVRNYVKYWQQDLSRTGQDVSYQITPSMMDNPWGTRRGAIYARNRCQQDGRRVAR